MVCYTNKGSKSKMRLEGYYPVMFGLASLMLFLPSDSLRCIHVGSDPMRACPNPDDSSLQVEFPIRDSVAKSIYANTEVQYSVQRAKLSLIQKSVIFLYRN
jgi:hypothetical protein